MLKGLVVFVLVISFVSALDVDLDCPDEIYEGEEFECDVEVIEGDGVYDLKVEVDTKRDSVLKVWDSGEWKSGYYYLKNFIKSEEVVRLRIDEAGKYDVAMKLRQGDSRNDFDVGRIRVEEARVEEEEDVEEVEEELGVDDEVIFLGGENEVILLSEGSLEEEWDYVSKDGMVVDWLPYAFCLFLIFLVGILILDRF